jgi:hypothetical protein
MRIRASLCLLACCTALAGCAAAAHQGQTATVTVPAVGRPPAPASAEAAVSAEAFTPYAALGVASNDGLAPGESLFTFAADCMTAAGYPSAAHSNNFVESNISLAIAVEPFAQPWGAWGYLGATEAQQDGFSGFTSVLSSLGIDVGPNPLSLSPAEQATAGNCTTIQQDLSNPIEAGPLALIGTLAKDIATGVAQDPAVQTATRAWSACMAKNGYSFPQPDDAAEQEQRAMYGKERGNANTAAPVSASVNQAQLAVAVTDAGCTQSSDLAGIYFAVQASYEQQLVTANQQALANAVSAYRAAYKNGLSKLEAQLRTAKAQPFPQAKPPAPRRSHAG